MHEFKGIIDDAEGSPCLVRHCLVICDEVEGVIAFSHEPVRLVAKASGISWLGVVPGTAEERNPPLQNM